MLLLHAKNVPVLFWTSLFAECVGMPCVKWNLYIQHSCLWGSARHNKKHRTHGCNILQQCLNTRFCILQPRITYDSPKVGEKIKTIVLNLHQQRFSSMIRPSPNSTTIVFCWNLELSKKYPMQIPNIKSKEWNACQCNSSFKVKSVGLKIMACVSPKAFVCLAKGSPIETSWDIYK